MTRKLLALAPGWSRAAGAAALLALGACASVPDLDRHMLHSMHQPVRMKGVGGGDLSRQKTAAILASFKARSPETRVLDRHMAVEQELAGTPLAVGNGVFLLEDGAATYPAMLAAIRSARHHVHMEVYIFDGDETGRQFAEALMERARAGIQVRLVIDGVGSISTPTEFFREMAAAGVEVYEYNPVAVGTVLSRGLEGLNRRNHRKLTLVDGRVAFIGGINISGVYSRYGLSGSRGGASGGKKAEPGSIDDKPWRDTQVRIEGPVVADLQRGFLRIWSQMESKPPLSGPGYFPALAPRGPHVVRSVDGWSASGVNPLYATLISAIDSAESEVQITNAYFVPHRDLLEALKSAARRGVDVKLLLPSKTDNWLVFQAGRSFYGELLEAGVKIFERESRLLHAKTASVDRVWSTVGSTNLDWRSLLHNEEVNVVVLGPEFGVQMNRMFERDLAASRAITREMWAVRPVADRVREVSARAWARLL